jgi:hypothetical protein
MPPEPAICSGPETFSVAQMRARNERSIWRTPKSSYLRSAKRSPIKGKSDQGRNGLKARGNGQDFLGYNFSLSLAAHGPKRRYWRVAPSKKSVQTRDSTTASDDLQPTATYTDYRINRTAQPAPAGMENYYGKRHCGAAMQRIN